MARIVKKPEERKNEILDVAEQLFSQVGYEATSTNKIAKAAGIAQGTLFYHFESKDALADALIARQLGEDLAVFQKVSQSEQLSGFQKLAWFFVFELDDDFNHLSRYHYMTASQNLVLQQKMSRQLVATFTPVLTAWLIQAQGEKSVAIDDPTLTAEFFLTTFHHWVDSSLYPWTKSERVSRIEQVQPFFEKLFGLEPNSLALEKLRACLPAEYGL